MQVFPGLEMGEVHSVEQDHRQVEADPAQNGVDRIIIACRGDGEFQAAVPIVTANEGTPALFNDEALVARVVPVFERVLGKENVLEVDPVMGGEDFSRYGRAGVPIFLFRLGSVDAERLAGYTSKGEPPPSLTPRSTTRTPKRRSRRGWWRWPPPRSRS